MDRFAECLPLVLKHEGGFSNHPKDPGGATMRGVTQRTYDAWRAQEGQVRRPVQEIADDEVAAVYRVQYWNAVRADSLPPGLDYAVFDFAVNSGPSRAAQFLQRILDVPVDGIIGVQTLAAVGRRRPESLIEQLCKDRLAWLKRLKTWPTFGRGWERRVREVETNAWYMSNRLSTYNVQAATEAAKSGGEERASVVVTDAATNPRALGALTTLIGSAAGLANGTGPVQWAFGALIVLVGVLLVIWAVRR